MFVCLVGWLMVGVCVMVRNILSLKKNFFSQEYMTSLDLNDAFFFANFPPQYIQI
ncbi:unnamed protein product [Meloidogyne enterolobii]|uniref:Uncharacterized protein n=1 Tax=Meloidogyne enterolobii TaxID=390850 RepID=A0ACB1AJF8_MELEN